MSIELIQAAQQALSALEKSQPHPSNPVIGLTNQDFIDHEETIRQLRTAIQQAEAQQPATPEPVAWPLRAQVWKRESTQEWVLEIAGTLGDTDMNIRHTQPLSVAYENVPGLPTFYTHPAPGVPDDAKRLNWLDDTNKRFRMGWEVGQAPAGNVSIRTIITGGKSIRDAIDAAMLAAK